MSETLRIDTELYEKAEKLFRELGLDIHTAVHLFLLQSLRENGLPFTPRLMATAGSSAKENSAARQEEIPLEAGLAATEALHQEAPSAVDEALPDDDDEVIAESFAPSAPQNQSAEHTETDDSPAPTAHYTESGQLSDLRKIFFDMGLIGMPLNRIRSLNQLYAIGEANPHVPGWRETYVSGDEPFALDLGVVRLELGFHEGGSMRMMDGRLPDEVLEADAVFPRELSAVFSSVIGQRLADVNVVRVRRDGEEKEQLRMHFSNGCTLVFSPEREWAALWLCDAHGSVMFAPETVWRRAIGERAWLALR
ncbi:MAG: type II toxin-antitoxin system RelB/DinJ family antitoxin [Mailhella sp.]|nr:type II toxin-antitoxin system RelB/DinJ family antitoxin [Mailhella sp.]